MATEEMFKSGKLTINGMRVYLVEAAQPGEYVLNHNVDLDHVCANCGLTWNETLLDLDPVNWACLCGHFLAGLLDEAARRNIAFDLVYDELVDGREDEDEDLDDLLEEAREEALALPPDQFMEQAQARGFRFETRGEETFVWAPRWVEW